MARRRSGIHCADNAKPEYFDKWTPARASLGRGDSWSFVVTPTARIQAAIELLDEVLESDRPAARRRKADKIKWPSAGGRK
jgi:hypothetical protein